MDFIVILLLLAAVAWFFLRSRRKETGAGKTRGAATAAGPSARGKVSSDEETADRREIEVDVGALTAAGADAWILNPNSPLPITVIGANRDLAEQMRSMLNAAAPWSNKVPELAFLVARNNVHFKEVDEFVAQNKERFTAEVQRRVSESTEWAGASDKDKLDLLREFREDALDALRTHTGRADLYLLLTGEPRNLADDDALLARFDNDYGLYAFYLSRLGRANGVVTVPADDYFRKSWEALAEKGLARRGKDIPRAMLLEGLRLKDLNAILTGTTAKPLGRKAKAVEACLALPDLDARLHQHISFRESFEAVPPPGMDVGALGTAFAYANALAEVVQTTYYTGTCTLQALLEKRLAGPGAYDAWEITNWNDPVPACARQFVKRYGRLPARRPPYHVGCDCRLECSYKDA